MVLLIPVLPFLVLFLALVLFVVLLFMVLMLLLLVPIMVLLFPVLFLLFPVLAILLVVEVNLWTLALSLLPQVKVAMEKQPRSVFHPMSRLHPQRKFWQKRKQGVRAPLRLKDSQRCHPTMKSKETILPQQWVTVLATTPRETNSKTLWKNNRKLTIHKRTRQECHQRTKIQNPQAVEEHSRRYPTQQRMGYKLNSQRQIP
ncbi:hypothetical protein TCSYLVIO_008001 [Trypanosoma cruzi]|nr:hypothetical protein TCSYLVIO_008001 [Trypanosoma cruzi]